MGDFCVPKRREVFDKIRKRLEHYRHHQSEAASRFLEASPSVYEQHKQDTLLLHQRWLESKAKKAAKQPKTNRDSSSLQADHRNLVVTKLKRKIDSINAEANSSLAAPSTITSTAETVFNFDDNDLQTCNPKNGKADSSKNSYGGNKHRSGLPSLSVQIVQQISPCRQQDTSQTIHTNVTVRPRYDTDSPKFASTNHSVHTSVQCKQEASEDSTRSSAANASSLSTADNSDLDSVFEGDIGIGIDDVDELQNFLDSIEKNEPSLLKELSKFDEICEQYHQDSESNESANMYGSLACASPVLSKGSFPNIGPCGHMGTVFDNNQNMDTSPMTNHSIQGSTAIPETTGPAAETLKQMAAQHQHQHSPGYPMKSIDHYSENLRNGNFSPNYSQMYRQVPTMASAFPYNHSANHHLSESAQMTPEMAAAMTYGGTKPLTHFPNEQGHQHNSPSSLQQLQNQVQSHFKPSMAASHQMQITQTQHMQLSQNQQVQMQLSQTQQVQMQQQPQQISLSQQQSFTIGQQQIVSDQMKIQMMEKLRMEQQQQHQQQQQHAQQARMPPQYMGRPPPDYNMHHSSRSQGGPYTNPISSNGNQNPLQTMQNMVNQTSAYGTVKSEVASSSSPGQTNNGIMSSQISAMQQQTLSASMTSNGHVGSLTQSSSSRPGFHPQQPPGYSPGDSSTHAQSSSTFTSAIMRNQRPPNVNVGPEGLNISQSRATADWARTNMLQSGHIAMRSSNSGSSSHGMSQSAAMSAHMMQYQQDRSPHYVTGPSSAGMAAATTNNMHAHQQQQQTRTSGQMRGVPGSSMMPAGSHMMMQHQGIQMNMHSSNSAYNMGGPTSGTESGPPSGYNMGGPTSLHSSSVSNPQTNGVQPASFSSQPTATMSNQDEFLHFLDNPLGNEPMFDSIHPSAADDFSLFDDILNGK